MSLRKAPDPNPPQLGQGPWAPKGRGPGEGPHGRAQADAGADPAEAAVRRELMEQLAQISPDQLKGPCPCDAVDHPSKQ